IGLSRFHVEREKRTIRADNRDATRQRLVGLVVDYTEEQRGIIQGLAPRPRIELDLADLDVVPFFGRKDRQGVFSIAQRAGWQRERLGEVLFGQEQPGDFSSVKFDAPIEFHIALADEKRVFVCVRVGGEFDLQPAVVRRLAGEFLPLGITGVAEVIELGIKDTQWLGEQRGNDAALQQEQGRPRMETAHNASLLTTDRHGWTQISSAAAGGGRRGQAKAPNTKHQTPEKLQGPKLQNNGRRRPCGLSNGAGRQGMRTWLSALRSVFRDC